MKKTVHALLSVAACALLVLSTAARAEDIDIYVDNAGTTGLPNVLFVLDNAASFSSSATNSCTYIGTAGEAPSLGATAGGVEQCALYNTVYALQADTVNIGLMVYESNNVRDVSNTLCGNSNGGCLVQPLIPMSGPAKATFLAWIKTWKTSGGAGDGYIKSSTERTGAVMQEAWAYYKGSTGLSGRTYTGVPAGCQKNFVIFIGNAFGPAGSPGDGGSAGIKQALTTAGATSSQLSEIGIPAGTYGSSLFSCGSYTMPSHSDSSGLYADEWARFMKQTDIFGGTDGSQGIVTYTIGLMGASCKPDYPALLTSMAKVGGGRYFATSSYEEIQLAINKILNEVQAVNSVFASATLPVSVNAQGTYLNQIYLGMFRPDGFAQPRWVGNLKQYQFALKYLDPTKPDPNTASLILADANGDAAISSAGTGFITPDADSFWTYKNTAAAPDLTVSPNTVGGFYLNDSRGAGLTYDSADGEQVDKGGVGQQIRKQVLTTNYSSTPSGPRKVYTFCPGVSLSGGFTTVPGTCNATLSDTANVFATTNAAITDALLSSMNSVSVSSLTRVGTVATVTTGSAHGFLVGDSITISGATQTDYNGIKTVITKPSTTTFTFNVQEKPVTPAVGGCATPPCYSVSVPGAGTQAITSLSRVNNLVTVTTAVAHGFSTGNSITIAGSNQSEYNNNFTVTVTSPTSFTFTIAENPLSPAGSGTATVGGVIRNIEAYNSNPSPGVVRAVGSTTVTVTTTANHGFANTGNVTLAGISDANGNQIARYNIGPVAYTKTGNKTFTFTIPTASLSPATSGTGTMTAENNNSRVITDLRRTGTTATATTAIAHGYTIGTTVNIGGTFGTNEGAYVGTTLVTSVPSSTTFNYTVSVTPATPATGTITVSKAGTSDRVALINWIRGEDNYGDEAGPGNGVTVRPSVHGDVLHSRPVVVNYGDTRGTVVFYGANDGQFRAINGSQTTALTNYDGVSVPAGGEMWSLVLPEHFSKLNRQRVNTPELKFPSTVLASAQTKDYFIDGPTGIYQKLKYQLQADGVTPDTTKPQIIDKAYLYLTMRRGGRFLYAVDVSTPNAPTVLWKIDQAKAGFSELGQTWSRPRFTLLNSYVDAVTSKAIPVLIFGAGYDPAQDSEPPTANTMGRGIFVVNALTGALIWSANSTCATSATCRNVPGMDFAIPSETTFVDRDNNGRTDKLYFGDTGGNLWRADVSASSTTSWTVTKVAAVGCDGGVCASGTTPRKFFFPPAVVMVGSTGAASSYDAIMLASGDREHPLLNTATNSAYNVTNRAYFIKDTGTSVGTPVTADVIESGLVNATSSAYTGLQNGYYITLALGEKSVNAPTTVFGTTYFGTNTPVAPSATSCLSNLGVAKGYALNPFDGSYSSNTFDGGGLPPSPVSGLVGIDIPATAATADSPAIPASTILRKFCIGCAGSTDTPGGSTPAPCNSALQNCLPDKVISSATRKTHWLTK